jgi:precorrin-6A/cobalt-precorrin-6A reductase
MRRNTANRKGRGDHPRSARGRASGPPRETWQRRPPHSNRAPAGLPAAGRGAEHEAPPPRRDARGGADRGSARARAPRRGHGLLAARGPAPEPLGLPTRIGGWGGEAEFRDWLGRERVHAILDATHPFDPDLGTCLPGGRGLGLDYLRFQRPPWSRAPRTAGPSSTIAARSRRRCPRARRSCSTPGGGAPRGGPLDQRTVHCRLGADRAAHPPERRGLALHHRPCALRCRDSEMRLYDRLGLDWIVLLNTGASEEHPKLEAARRLGMSLGLVRRPPQPEAPRTETVSEVMRWVRRRCDCGSHHRDAGLRRGGRGLPRRASRASPRRWR